MITNTEIQDFLQINLLSNSYSSLIKHDYHYNTDNKIAFSIQNKGVFELAKTDLSIFRERALKQSKLKGFNVGQVVLLPDGQIVTISHVWNDKVQTSGSQGSLYLCSGGGVSRSGGLDSGILKSDLIPTERTHLQKCWIFHLNSSGAHRGVFWDIPFKIYTVKDGADLSGVPQVEELAKRKLQEQSETITRINGNGQPYTRHMPEIHLIPDKPLTTMDIAHGTKKEIHGFKKKDLRTIDIIT